MLRDGEQARALRRDGNAVQRVRVKHALGVVPRAVNGAVDDETRGVDRKGRILELPPLLVEKWRREGRLDEERAELARLAEGRSLVELLRSAEVLAKLDRELRLASMPRFALEVVSVSFPG